MSTHHIRAYVRLDLVSSALRADAASYSKVLCSGVQQLTVQYDILFCSVLLCTQQAEQYDTCMTHVYGEIISILHREQISIENDRTTHQ
jgi:chorismate mutase